MTQFREASPSRWLNGECAEAEPARESATFALIQNSRLLVEEWRRQGAAEGILIDNLGDHRMEAERFVVSLYPYEMVVENDGFGEQFLVPVPREP
jgi:hypothetical protein